MELLKERKGSCGPKTRATTCRIEEFLQGRSSRLDMGRAAGQFFPFFSSKSSQAELSTVARHLKQRNCSCDPNLRSGSSRADDTLPLGVCCLSTAFSRDRIAGHPLFASFSASDDQIICVARHLLQKLAQCRNFDFPHRLPSQRVGHNIGQLNHITGLRFSNSRIEAASRMNFSVTPLQCGFKRLLRALAFIFGVAPQISHRSRFLESGMRNYFFKEQKAVFSSTGKTSVATLTSITRHPKIISEGGEYPMNMRLEIETQVLIFALLGLVAVIVAVLFFQSNATRLQTVAKSGQQQISIDVERPITNNTK